MKRRRINILVILTIVLSLLMGCGGAETVSSAHFAAEEAVTAEPTVESTAVMEITPAMETPAPNVETSAIEEPEENKVVYPLTEEPVTLTIWQAWPPFLSSYCSLQDCKTFEELERITGIHLEFTEVDSESANEKFSLMVAADACTDLLQGAAQKYSGGGTQAIQDEVLYDLTPYVDAYMPNYLAAIGDDENIRRTLVDDEGQMAQICALYSDYFYTDQGFFIRQDFLNKAGLEMPNTMDELENVLETFKSELGIPEPIVILAAGEISFLEKAYETEDAVVNGKLVNYAISDHMKNYYLKLHEWWEKGYVKEDFLSNNYSFIKPPEDTVYNDLCGMFNEDIASILTYEETSENPDFELRAMPQILLTPDQELHNAPAPSKLNEKYSISISTNCTEENTILACQMLDYMFTEEGKLLGNYGVEGYSFEYDSDGNPQFTAFILEHELGYQGAQTAFINPRIPCLVDLDVSKFAYNEAQNEAQDVWIANFVDSSATPPYYSMTSDEISIVYPILVDINTYVDEMRLKFIMGEADIERTWDEYVKTIQSFGYDTMVEIYKGAYERFISR